MSTVKVTTPFNIDLDFEVAPLIRRIFAWFLDISLLVVYAQIMRTFVIALFYQKDTDAYPTGADIMLVTLPMLFYPLLMEVLFQGQSLGKKATGIRVLSLEGGEPQLGQYLLRWIFRFWEWPLVFGMVAFNTWGLFGQILLCCFLGFGALIIIAITAHHQRIGDLSAGTAVVDTRKQFSIQDTVFLQISKDDYRVSFPEVMRLSDRDINAIKTVLTQTRESGQYQTAHRISIRIKEVLNIESRLEVTDFLEKLLEDYNFLATKNE